MKDSILVSSMVVSTSLSALSVNEIVQISTVLFNAIMTVCTVFKIYFERKVYVQPTQCDESQFRTSTKK